MTWVVWVLGAVVLVGAGVGATYLPRARERDLRRRGAWSAARAAVDSATVSRDAAGHAVPDADDLLTRAELLVAGHGGARAAAEALDCAERADRMWRAAADG
jgi:uncharacterized protein DUF6403